jgi:hypothetical protein
MVTYFINLLLYKLYILTHIDVNSISNQNNNYMCLVAECSNIIRASIKKYVRLRTNKNQTLCSKNYLEKRNSIKYKCNYPLKNNNICPSFSILRKKGKSCKNIIQSSKKSSNKYNFMSTFIRSSRKNNTSRNHITKPNNYTPLKIILNRTKTRKIQRH